METVDLAIKFVSSSQGSGSGTSGSPISSTGDFVIFAAIILAFIMVASGILLYRAWKKSTISTGLHVDSNKPSNFSSYKKTLFFSPKNKIIAVVCCVSLLLCAIAFIMGGIHSAQASQEVDFKGTDIIGYVDETTGNVTFNDGAITNIGNTDAIVEQVTTKRPDGIDDGNCTWTLKSGDVGLFNGVTSTQGTTKYLDQELNVLIGASIPLSVSVDGLGVDTAKSLIDKNVVLLSFNLKEKESRIEVPLPIKTGDLTYNGKDQIGVSYDSQYSKYFTITGDASAVDAGDYSATFTLKDKITTKWADNTIEDKTINWSIAKTTPKITNLTCADIFYGETPLPDASADFGNIKYAYSSSEEGIYGDWNTSNLPGTYWVKAFVDKSDNWEAAESSALSFKVNEKSIIVTPYPAEDQIYTGNPLSLGYVSTKPDDCNIEYSVEGMKIEGNPTAVDAGEYEVEYRATKTGYKEEVGTFSATINSAKIEVPKAITGLVYNAKEQAGVVLPQGENRYTLSDNTKTEAGDYCATATLTDKKNYEWKTENPTSEDQKIDWCIAKKTLNGASLSGIKTSYEYTGKTIHPEPTKVTTDDGIDVPCSSYTLNYPSEGDYIAQGYYVVEVNSNKDSNFKDSISQGFLIIEMTKSLFINPIENQTYSANEITPDITVKDKDGNILDQQKYTKIYINNKNAGTAQVAVTGIDEYIGCYGLVNFTINKKELTVSGVSVSDKDYDGTTTATFRNIGQLDGVISPDVVTINSATVNFFDANVGQDKPLNINYIISQDANNYEVKNPTDIVASINPIKVEVPKAKIGLIYNESEQTGVVLPDGETRYQLSDNIKIDAGSYKAIASLTDKTNYVWNVDMPTSDDQNIPWTVEKKQSTLTLDPISASYTVPTAKTFTYKYDGDGDVSVGSSDKGVAITSLDILANTVTVTPIAKGEATVTVGGAEGRNYKSVNATHKVDVEAGSITVSQYPAEDQTYTGKALSLGYVSAEPEGCTIEYSVDGKIVEGAPTAVEAGEHIVEYKVTKTGYNDVVGTFSSTINPAKINVPQAEAGLVYNAKEQSGVKQPEGENRFTLNNNTGTNAGSYSATATLIDKKNYIWNIDKPTSDNQKIDWIISKKTLNGAEISGIQPSYEYTGDVIHPQPTKVTTDDGIDVPNISYTLNYPSKGDYIEQGSYIVEVCANNDSNFKDSVSQAFLIIKQEESLTIDPIDDCTYEAKDINPDVTVKDNKGNKLDPSKYSKIYVNNKNAGMAQVAVTGLDEYLGCYGIGSFTINKKELTVSGASVADKVYDGTTTATFEEIGQLEGVISPDVVTIDSATASFVDSNVGKDKATQLNYVISDKSGNNNYSVKNPTDVVASINPAKINVPQAEAGLVYNAKEQTGVKQPEGENRFTLKNNTETNAGSYNAIASLTDKINYVWNVDMPTSDDQNIPWTIEKKQATLTLDPISASYTVPTAKTFTYKYDGDGDVSVDSSDKGVVITSLDILTNTVTVTPIAKGEATITVGGAEGRNYKSVNATHKAAVEAGSITVSQYPTEDQTYTGKALSLGYVSAEPEGCTIEYSVDGKTVEDVPTAVDAGEHIVEYKVTKTGYNDVAGTFSSTINPAKINVPQAEAGLVYNTKEQTGVKLPEGEIRYILSNASATNAGTYSATATLIDKKNYIWNIEKPSSDDQKIDWNISKKTLNGAEISGIQPSYEYTGDVIHPQPTKVTTDDGIDVPNNSYTLNYPSKGDYIEQGSYLVEVGANNDSNFKDSVSQAFLIIEMSNSLYIDPIADQTYNSSVITPEINVRDKDKNLIDPSKYSKIYINNVNTGIAQVAVTGTAEPYLGCYGIGNFAINKKELTVSGASVTDKVYDGTTTAIFEDIGQLEGVISPDVVIIDSATANFIDPNVGKDKAIQLNYVISDKSGNNNYSVKNPTDVVASINPAKVNVPQAEQGLVYNAKEQVGVRVQEGETRYKLTDNIKINAGNYSATVELADKLNYVWNIDTPSSDNQIIPWTIAKATNNMTFSVITSSYTSDYSDNPVEIDFPGVATNAPENLEYGVGAVKADDAGSTNDGNFIVKYDDVNNKWYLICGANTAVGTYQLKIWAKSGGINYEEKYVPDADSIITNFIWTVIDPVIHVKSVELDKTQTNLAVGKSTKLNAKVLPENATDKSVKWSSIDENVATVDQNGNITAKNKGNTTITVTTNDGGFNATCAISVYDPSQYQPILRTVGGDDVLFLPSYSGDVPPCNFYEKDEDDSYKKIDDITNMSSLATEIKNHDIKSIYTDAGNLTFYGLIDKSWNDTFEDIDAAGYATGLKSDFAKELSDASVGTVYNFTDETRGAWDAKDAILDKSEPLPTLNGVPYGTSLENTSEFYGAYKDILTVNAYAPFSSRTNGDDLAYDWFINNDKTRWVSTKCSGVHAIVLTHDFNISVTGVSLDKTEMDISLEGAEKLTATVKPHNASDKSVSWSSSDENVASVDENGNVFAHNLGIASITVETNDGGYKASCIVNVKQPKPIVRQVGSDDVVFLPAYSGDIAPCNFYYKQEDDSFKKINGITNMSSLAAEIGSIDNAKNIYADANNQIFYGTVARTWNEVFDKVDIAGYATSLKADFAKELSDASVGTVYNFTDETRGAWDAKDAILDTSEPLPTLNGVPYGTSLDKITEFYGAYKDILCTSSNGALSSRADAETDDHVFGWYVNNDNSKWSSLDPDIKYATVLSLDTSISVTGVSLDKGSIDLGVGQTSKLNATVEPYNASDKSVKWSSSDGKTVSVDSEGHLTALQAGKATITATTNDGGFTASCEVDVIYRPISNMVDGDNVVFLPAYSENTPPCNFYIKSGETYSIIEGITDMASLANAIGSPENALNVYTDAVDVPFYGVTQRTWSSTFSGVDSSGYATGLNDSFAKSLNDLHIQAIYNFTDETRTPWDGKGAEIHSDKPVPTVNGINYGTNVDDDTEFYGAYKNILTSASKIPFSSRSYESDSVYAWNVNSKIWNDYLKSDIRGIILTNDYSIPVNGVTLDKSNLYMISGQSTKLNANISPVNATNKSIIWSSSDNDVAYVDENGVVFAYNRGNATITAKTVDGGYTASCKIAVNDEPENLVKKVGQDDVIFLPAYSGDTPPCNFYIKDIEYTKIEGITDMASLAKIISTPENAKNIYTDANSVSFYGVLSREWNHTFNDIDSRGYANSLNSDFSKMLLDSSVNTVYNFNDYKRTAWDAYNADMYADMPKPTLNEINYGTSEKYNKNEFYWAYKNLLGENAETPLSSRSYTTDSVFYWDVGLGRWDNIFNDDEAAVILERPMGCVPVDGISLDHSDIDVAIGRPSMLTATVTPVDATNKSVVWTSSNNEVASVDEYGFIDAHKEGTVTITATTVDGGYSANCNVNVKYKSIVRNINGEDTVFLPAYSDNTPPCSFYKTEDFQYTKLDVTNMADLAAKIGDKTEAKSICVDVSTNQTFYGTVDKDWDSTFKEESQTSISLTDSMKNILKDGASEYKYHSVYFYNSDDTTPASKGNWNAADTASASQEPKLDGIGYNAFNKAYSSLLSDKSNTVWSSCSADRNYSRYWVTDFAEGQWSSDYKGSTHSLVVSMDYVPTQGISLDKSELYIPAVGLPAVRINPTVLPNNATEKSCNFISSNPNVAAVDDSGNVVGKSEGSTTITVSTNDGHFSATCSVEVSGNTYKQVSNVDCGGQSTNFLPVYSDNKFLRNNRVMFYTDTAGTKPCDTINNKIYSDTGCSMSELASVYSIAKESNTLYVSAPQPLKFYGVISNSWFNTFKECNTLSDSFIEKYKIGDKYGLGRDTVYCKGTPWDDTEGTPYLDGGDGGIDYKDIYRTYSSLFGSFSNEIYSSWRNYHGSIGQYMYAYYHVNIDHEWWDYAKRDYIKPETNRGIILSLNF